MVANSRSKAAPETAPEETPNADVETPGVDWGKIDNIADARAALGVVVSVSEILGDGSEFLKDKNVLIDKPFIILDWRFNKDEAGHEYVNVLIMAPNGYKARFNDGTSNGVYAQLKQIQEECGHVGVEVKNGLRKSTYTNEHGVGTSWYLSV